MTSLHAWYSWSCDRVLSSLSLYWRAGVCEFIMKRNEDHDHTVDHDIITHVLHGPATESSLPRYRSMEERASVISLWQMIIIITEHDIITHLRSTDLRQDLSSLSLCWRASECDLIMMKWRSWSYSRSWHYYTCSSRTCDRIPSSLSLYWRASGCDLIMTNDYIIIIEHDIITHVLHGPATESLPRYRSIEERAVVISLWQMIISLS
jgi:hypothetical protein